jgi:hypothetical protein
LVVIFEDKPEMLAVRRQREQAHLEYLREHESEIVIAGGLREEPGGTFVGGLWVLEVDSRARAIELIENDPYFVPEHRQYKLRVWGKAFSDRKVTL